MHTPNPEELDVIPGAKSSPAGSANGARKKLFAGFAGALVLGGGGFFAYEALFAGKHVSTDNAYVDAETAQVTALTSGPVAEVKVRETQAVKKGDVLVILDDVDRRLELAQALSSLDQIERSVRGSSSRASCMVMVDPPETMRPPLPTNCTAARASASGSTPRCARKRRSS